MKRVTILLSLGLIAAGTACTQQNNQVAQNRVYRRSSYTQTGSNIPSTYRESSGDPGNTMTEQDRTQLQNYQNTQTTSMGPPAAGGGR